MNDYKSIWQKYTKSKSDFTLEEYQELQLEIAFLKKQLSSQSKLIKKLKEDAHQDSLTQLWNRRKFQEDLDKSIAYNRRYSRSSGLLFIDLNHFKAINDTLGHLAGDNVLQHVSEILKKNCRINDEVYRLGGDEFVIIMPEVTQEVVQAKSKTLENAISQSSMFFKGQEVCLSASIGFEVVDGSKNKNNVLESADKQMYKVKQQFHSLQLVS
jgi:diguanylate cyclase (GGDEF)-like protein|tara:strand:- start:5287 stop:5922 length:636 start_codon:yes stop_codon:yes gene_type:complete